VITLGAKGSIITAKDETYHIEAKPIKTVVDTTGAGDLFASGFLFGYTHGYNMQTSGNLGSSAAASVLNHLGARPEKSLVHLISKTP
jgi:sugar/nucleoside kinase (ribokinase family)